MTVATRSPNTLPPVPASIAGLADLLVAAQRVVPGLTIDDDGTARSWWGRCASDRGRLAALLDGNDVGDHARLARAWSIEVVRRMQEQLVGDGVELPAPRSGRRTVPDAWIRSLTGLDRRLLGSLDADHVDAFAAVVDEWVRSGIVGLGRARLCIRIHEPLVAASHVFRYDRWWNPAVEDRSTDRAYRLGPGDVLDPSEVIEDE